LPVTDCTVVTDCTRFADMGVDTVQHGQGQWLSTSRFQSGAVVEMACRTEIDCTADKADESTLPVLLARMPPQVVPKAEQVGPLLPDTEHDSGGMSTLKQSSYKLQAPSFLPVPLHRSMLLDHIARPLATRSLAQRHVLRRRMQARMPARRSSVAPTQPAAMAWRDQPQH
jgi:hypothetical protein